MAASETKILEIQPVIPARDMEESIRFYRYELGFELLFAHSSTPGEPIDYAGLKRGKFGLHLQALVPGQDDAMPLIRVRVENIEPLYKGIPGERSCCPTGQLEAKPWGTNEFGLYDPSGAAIVFYEDLR